MATIIKATNREAWLAARQQGIGSSEVGTLLGVNPYETPYQLWRRKKGLEAPKAETFAMRAGHVLEDAVAQFWHQETGRTIDSTSAGDWLAVDENKPFLRVSPDRLYWLDGESGEQGILECKTTQKQIDADDLPKTWFCQLQYQLGVMGLAHGSLAWLTAGRAFDYQDIEANADFIAWMMEAIERFWVDCIIGDKEPPLTTASDIVAKYPKEAAGKSIEATADIVDVFAELKSLRGEIARMERQKEALEERIKLAFGDAETMEYCGTRLATWKASKDSSRFDAKAFTADHPELAAKYTRQTAGVRRLLITEK